MEPTEEDTLQSEIPLSEDERELDECDEYEQKYNFRFEEPDKEFVSLYFSQKCVTDCDVAF